MLEPTFYNRELQRRVNLIVDVLWHASSGSKRLGRTRSSNARMRWVGSPCFRKTQMWGRKDTFRERPFSRCRFHRNCHVQGFLRLTNSESAPQRILAQSKA
jgi:hypothetical protein